MNRPLLHLPPSIKHQQAEDLLCTIRSIRGDKHITVNVDGRPQSFDMASSGEIEPEPRQALVLQALLRRAFVQMGSVIVRSYSSIKVQRPDAQGNLVWEKEQFVCGVFLHSAGVFPLSAEKIRKCYSFDSETGEPLELATGEHYVDWPKMEESEEAENLRP